MLVADFSREQGMNSPLNKPMLPVQNVLLLAILLHQQTRSP